ncbi:MAG: SUMF1/EgtB/PvdO family nonheme iron enzyme [Blastocatellia bacterium]|nr:SUMF1/EgtB/PvdO family nonheme iron enzyme [Blastocatellia bacterium]
MSKPSEFDPAQTNEQTVSLSSANIGKAEFSATSDSTLIASSSRTQAEIETAALDARNAPQPVDGTLITGSASGPMPHMPESTLITGSGVLGTGYAETIVTGSGVLQGQQGGINETIAVAGASGPATAPVGRQTQAVKGSDGDLAIGETFQGKYQIVKLLGVGGMGRVYKALHVDLDTMVAIKLLNANMSADRDAIERFKREAQANAKIKHPNAVQVLDYGVVDGLCFIVMEFLEGESLRERIFHRRRIPLQEVAHFAEQVCYVLEFMHRKAITHRDLKPDNIFYQVQEGMEMIKVLDFGIAKVNKTETHAGSDLTREGMMIGTPRYMSPEQCQGLPIVDGRSDLYSLGVVMYEMLSGTVPFDADNPFSIALKHINSPLPPLNNYAPDIPQPVCDVIHKVLEKDPKDRYQSAKDFSAAFLKAAAAQSTVQMDMLAGSSAVNWEEFQKTNANRINADTAGGTLPIGKMGGDTLPLGTESSTNKTKILQIESFPIWKSAALTVVIVGALFGVGKYAGFFGPNVQQGPGTNTDTKPIPKDPLAEGPLKDFVLIPGGKFLMGSDPVKDASADNKIADDETSVHEVEVGKFYLSKYEVTNAQYKEFVKATNRTSPKTWVAGDFPPGEDKIPVTNVSWEDATAYCKWLSQKENLEFRLPTENEWEFAARGEKRRLFPWGMSWNEDRTNSNREEGKSSPIEVDSNSPRITQDLSPFGIFAMAGNVCEWTSSTFETYPKSKYKATPDDLKCKVFRGGSFKAVKFETRTTARKWNLANFVNERVGFRLAANPPKS